MKRGLKLGFGIPLVLLGVFMTIAGIALVVLVGSDGSFTLPATPGTTSGHALVLEALDLSASLPSSGSFAATVGVTVRENDGNGDLFVGSPLAATPGGAPQGLGGIYVLPDDDHDGIADSTADPAAAHVAGNPLSCPMRPDGGKITGSPKNVPGPPADPMVEAAAPAALACCAPPAAVVRRAYRPATGSRIVTTLPFTRQPGISARLPKEPHVAPVGLMTAKPRRL